MWETNQKKVSKREESGPLDQVAIFSELELRPDPELVKTGVALGIEIDPRPLPLTLFPMSLVL